MPADFSETLAVLPTPYNFMSKAATALRLSEAVKLVAPNSVVKSSGLSPVLLIVKDST